MDNLTGAVVFFSCCRMMQPISSCTIEDANHPEAIEYIDTLMEALMNPREDSTGANGSDTSISTPCNGLMALKQAFQVVKTPKLALRSFKQ